MININKVRFSYLWSNFNFRINSLDISDGEKVAVTAPSGFGKTTFLKLLSGILTPDEGNINIDNETINNFSDKKRRAYRISKIGFIFQDFELIQYLNLKDNIALPYLINPTLNLNNEIEKKILHLAKKFGLNDKLSRNVEMLSQGEKQRVAICRAIISSPRILLADEPTGNLDPDNKETTVKELINYSNENNAILIMVTHDFSLLNKFDRTINLVDLYEN